MKTKDNIDILLRIIRFIQKVQKGSPEKGKETHAHACKLHGSDVQS